MYTENQSNNPGAFSHYQGVLKNMNDMKKMNSHVEISKHFPVSVSNNVNDAITTSRTINLDGKVISEALKKCVDLFGKEVLQEPEKLKNVIGDLLPDCDRELESNLLYIVLKDFKLGFKLLKTEETEEARTCVCNSILLNMSTFFSDEVAKTILQAFTDAIGWNISLSSDYSKERSDLVKEKDDLIQERDKLIKENGELVAKKDGVSEKYEFLCIDNPSTLKKLQDTEIELKGFYLSFVFLFIGLALRLLSHFSGPDHWYCYIGVSSYWIGLFTIVMQLLTYRQTYGELVGIFVVLSLLSTFEFCYQNVAIDPILGYILPVCGYVYFGITCLVYMFAYKIYVKDR